MESKIREMDRSELSGCGCLTAGTIGALLGVLVGAAGTDGLLLYASLEDPETFGPPGGELDWLLILLGAFIGVVAVQIGGFVGVLTSKAAKGYISTRWTVAGMIVGGLAGGVVSASIGILVAGVIVP